MSRLKRERERERERERKRERKREREKERKRERKREKEPAVRCVRVYGPAHTAYIHPGTPPPSFLVVLLSLSYLMP
jgi:hypothetical protein